MPLYDFKCRACGEEFEALVRVPPREDEGPACPSCRSTDLERLLSQFAVSSETTQQAAVKDSKARQMKDRRDQIIAQREYERKHCDS